MSQRVLLLALIVGLLGAGSLLLLRAPAPAPRAEAAAEVPEPPLVVEEEEPAAAPSALSLQRLLGRVEVRRQGAGEWVAARADEELGPADVLRTGKGSSVEIVSGDQVVRLLAGTEVTVQELAVNLTGFLLAHGLVGAEAGAKAGASPRTLEVRAEGTDTVASMTSGAFRMSHNGAGTVAVGVTDGEVRVSGSGGAVVLKQGERTLVRPGMPPEAPEPVARSLLLKVAWPEKREMNRRVITVTGRTERGALVFALGERVPVDQDGGFSARIELKEGKNRIRLEAADVSGNEIVDDGQLVVNTRGAKSRFDTDDLWRR